MIDTAAMTRTRTALSSAIDGNLLTIALPVRDMRVVMQQAGSADRDPAMPTLDDVERIRAGDDVLEDKCCCGACGDQFREGDYTIWRNLGLPDSPNMGDIIHLTCAIPEGSIDITKGRVR